MTLFDDAAEAVSSNTYDYEPFFNYSPSEDENTVLTIVSDGWNKDWLRTEGISFLDEVASTKVTNIYKFGTLGSGFHKEYNFPRNVPWKDFPVLLPCKHKIEGFIALDAYRRDHLRSTLTKGRGAPVEKVAKLASKILIGSSGTANASPGFISSVLDLLDNIHCSGDMHLFDEGKYRLITRQDLIDLSSSTKAFSRFSYNYKFNNKVILGKAFRRVVEEGVALPDKSLAKRLLLGNTEEEPIFSRAFDTPLGLQILFKVKASENTYQFPTDLAGVNSELSVARAAFGSLINDYPHWRGTGKYPPVKVGIIGSGLIYLIRDGYITLNKDEDRLVLSEFAIRLLELVHPDCEDPDVIGRWPELSTDPKVAKSRDRWITTHFRKMKAFLETGGGGSKWK